MTGVGTSKYFLREGIRNVWANRMMSIASSCVLMICLLLTGIAGLASLNLEEIIKSIGQRNSVNVFISDELNPTEVQNLEEEIKNMDNVATCDFYSKDEALSEYKEKLGSAFSLLEGQENSLPDVFRVSLKDLNSYEETIETIKNIHGVDKVGDRIDTVRKLNKLSHLITLFGISFVSILGVVSLFIISNTVKITMYNRRLEINIMKSIGATNGFIRIPFIIEGIIIGLVSALISSGLLMLIYNIIIDNLKKVMSISAIPFNSVILPVIIIFCLMGIIFGLMGGVVSITRYLRKEGENIVR